MFDVPEADLFFSGMIVEIYWPLMSIVSWLLTGLDDPPGPTTLSPPNVR